LFVGFTENLHNVASSPNLTFVVSAALAVTVKAQRLLFVTIETFCVVTGVQLTFSGPSKSVTLNDTVSPLLAVGAILATIVKVSELPAFNV
jgi:hypothetical protein